MAVILFHNKNEKKGYMILYTQNSLLLGNLHKSVTFRIKSLMKEKNINRMFVNLRARSIIFSNWNFEIVINLWFQQMKFVRMIVKAFDVC